MGITDPKKPWIIVSQFLDGTQPPDAFIAELRALFAHGSYGGTSIADFWTEQTLGVVDVSTSVVLPWQSSGWSVLTHPGKDGGIDRGSLAARARSKVANMGDYRGVIAVYNYPCNAGDVGSDVVLGLGGYGSKPGWADDSFRQCTKCFRILPIALQGLNCAGGGAHAPGSRSYMTVTSHQVPKVRTVDACQRCGTLYASDVAARPGVTECPGGAGHLSMASVKVLAGWPDPPADREWSVCSWCRCIAPDGAPNPCPARAGGHEPIAKAAIHFPYLDVDVADISPRGFLCHEMGHAYGFVHGRGLEPRSGALEGDCWPGAYGDRLDIMSYQGCDSYTPTAMDPDAGHGRAGPGLSITHLLAGEVLHEADLAQPSPEPATPFVQIRLRPATASGSPGSPGAKFGPYVAEYRRRAWWDRSLNVPPGPSGTGPGAVVVRYLPAEDREVPTLVPSTMAQQALGAGDSFQPRLGMGTVALTVGSIEPDGSSATVVFWEMGGGRPTRWLVVPYRSSDSAAPFDRKKTETYLAAVERFWRDMAEGASFVAGGTVLSPDKDPGGAGTFSLAQTVASLGQLPADQRAAAVVEAALSWPNPTDSTRTLPMDWRWFSGLILVSVDGFGDGYMGIHSFDPGVFPDQGGCETADHPRRLLPKLLYDVIELPMASLSFARLLKETGVPLGFSPNDDPYSGMAPDGVASRYSPPAASPPFGESGWGPVGPSVSTGELKARGWLPDSSIRVVQPHGGGGISPPTVGSVTISPVFSESLGRGGMIRAEIGPFSFELRANSGWDRGVGGPVILAYPVVGPPQPLLLGQQVTWGGPLPEISGGGRVEVSALSDDSATISYWIMERPILVAGGGVLHAGGTVLFGADGRIHRIPPGDPQEKTAGELIQKLQEMGKGGPVG